MTEINKINEQILECYQNFDNQLMSLHQRKVKTQQAIYQVMFNLQYKLVLQYKLSYFFQGRA